MDLEIIARDAFTVIGVEESFAEIEENDPGFKRIWMERFMEHHDWIVPLSSDKVYYGVFFHSNEPDTPPVRFLAGMAVDGAADLPQGWVVREIPAARYAVFETTLARNGETTHQAFSEWIPASPYEYDRPKPHLDYLPPDVEGPDSEVAVWIPVREKA